jgi:hypothetical protein
MKNTREDSIHLDKLIEIYGISYKGIWYEVHVNNDIHKKERRIEQTFAEIDKVTPEIYKHLEEVVSKIKNP